MYFAPHIQVLAYVGQLTRLLDYGCSPPGICRREISWPASFRVARDAGVHVLGKKTEKRLLGAALKFRRYTRWPELLRAAYPATVGPACKEAK